jgi:hypothetical protein
MTTVPVTCIKPTGWHHTTETYHHPYSSHYKPHTRFPSFLFGFLTLEDGTNRLLQNVSKELPLLTA